MCLKKILPATLLVFVALCISSMRAAAPKWLPVDPSDLSATASQIDPEANSEILYRLMEIDGKAPRGTMYRNYQRLKIFNDKGVRELEKIDIPSSSTDILQSVHARVIKPDGTIINIGKKDFHTRDAVRHGRQKLQVTSFSFPSLTPGCIVEWQSESISSEHQDVLRMLFQSSTPTRLFRLRYRLESGARYTPVNCAWLKSNSGNGGYYSIEKSNIPALKIEPFMPPVDSVQEWMLFYTIPFFYPLQDVFAGVLESLGQECETYIKPQRGNDPVQAKVAALVAGASTDRERLARIHDFCRANIRNTDHDSSGFTASAIKTLKKNKTAAQVLERGYGNRFEITALFIALVRAAGYDAWISLCWDRSNLPFEGRYMNVFVPTDIIACVPLEGKDIFYDPASIYLPAETLHWFNESTGVRVHRKSHISVRKSNPKSTAKTKAPRPKQGFIQKWGRTDASTAEGSLRKRTGTFRIDAEGNLEGDVRIEPQGQFEFADKNRYGPKELESRVTDVRNEILERLPNAEVTDIIVHNANSPTEPLAITYHIRVPDYANMTDQRMFVQPAFFQKGVPSIFTAVERTHDIYFEYPWSQEDDISITLPDGFSIEELSNRVPIPKSEVFTYSNSLVLQKNTNTLRFQRGFVFKEKQIPCAEYNTLKAIFDGIHAQDNSTIILRANLRGQSE